MFRYFLVTLISSVSLWSQAAGTATMVGRVADSSGSVIPGAKVTAVNTETAFVSETITTAEGTYNIPYLAPGNYRLTVETTGFKRHVREGIQLRTGETPRLDITLEVGAVTESVQVDGAAALLETETSASGLVLSGEQLLKIPVPQKRAIRMLFYYPGASAINGFHILGQRGGAIGYTMDGVNGKEPGIGITGGTNEQISTTQDAFQEVKVYTTGTPAEFGHSAGGLMSVVFKSGGNDFHGSAEDRYINKAMIHRNYLEQLPRTNPFSYHETTFLFTGPVLIPKIYNGRNKTFWLAGWERHLENAGASSVRNTVPTPAMYGGDFSFGGQTNPPPLAVYNPYTTRQTGTTFARDPFPGNIIPKSLIDPAVQRFLDRKPFAEPNQPGGATATGPIENMVANNIKKINRTRWDVKIDHQFTANHKIFGRYSHARHRADKGDRQEQFAWIELDPNRQPAPVDHVNFAFSDMLIISPTMSNEIRAGFNRRARSETAFTRGGDWAKQLGIPNVSGETFPFFNIGYTLGALPSFQNIGEDFMFQNNLSKVSGKHTLKMGYEILRTRYNATSQALPGGTYNFGATNAPFVPNTGQTFASFLLGTVTSATYTQDFGSWLPRWWSHQAYIQDDWKPLRNLTINLGVRWSYETPFQTKYGQQAQFDPSVTDPISGRLGAITHPKGPIGNRDLNNFAPRVGLAWNFHPKMVFRSSFGMIHQDLFAQATSIMFNEYLATATIQAPVGDPRHVFRLSDGPPAFRFNQQPDGSVPFVGNNFSTRSASWYDPKMRMPYVLSWSGGLQYEFARNWLFDGQYQGQSGVGLVNNWDINAIRLDVSNDTPTLENIFRNVQNFKPYTQFGSVTHFSNYGHNSYHAGTFRIEKRYAAGLAFNAFYTLQKTLTETEGEGGDNGITFYNRRLEKARASYDVRHRFVNVLSYQLPFGAGKRWMNGNGLSNQVLGGWELTWTQTLQSGPPFNVGFAGSANRFLPGESRPNILTTHQQAEVSDWTLGANRFPSLAQNPYLKSSSFSYPAPFTAGTLGRNVFEAPGLNWTQLSLAKWWQIKERFRVQLRLDANNFPIKQPQFGNPGNSYNTNALNAFARIGTATRGAFSDVGTANSNLLLVLKAQF